MRSLTTVTLLALLGSLPAGAASDDALVADAQATVQTFKTKAPKTEKFFSSAAGYAVFPTVAKGGFIVGGAGGDGVLFVGGKPVGTANMGQASIGLQLGGQTYSEIIFFENPSTLSDFKNGHFQLDAQATAVAISAGASADANYTRGVAVFTMTKAGLMYEASVGGQKFTFHPFSGSTAEH
ncbi:MAG TPA: lipid-binding SYLF domain-containing protein [Myxococcaceae bacterium]|jgi:lipid-binding SYLF domain-containing protein